MAKVVLLAIVGLGVLIPRANAADWKVNATQSETVEVNSNRLLLATPKGESYNTISSLLLDARALAPGSSLTLDGNINYRTFDGPGESTTLDSFNKSISAAYEKSTKYTIFNALASRVERETSTLQLLENGEATSTGTTVITSGGGGFKHSLSPRDTIAGQTILSNVNTSRTTALAGGAGNLTNSLNSVTSTLNLIHAVNPVTNWIPSLLYRHLSFAGSRSEIDFWRATTGIDTQLTNSWSLRASAGAIATSGGSASTTGTTSSGSGYDWVADVLLRYKYTYGTISFVASQSNGPNTFGQFSTNQTLGTSLTYTINDESSIMTNVSYSHRIFGTSTSDVIVNSVTYTHSLTRDLHASLTYRFSRRTSGTSISGLDTSTTAQSNAVVLVLRREATILP